MYNRNNNNRTDRPRGARTRNERHGYNRENSVASSKIKSVKSSVVSKLVGKEFTVNIVSLSSSGPGVGYIDENAEVDEIVEEDDTLESEDETVEVDEDEELKLEDDEESLEDEDNSSENNANKVMGNETRSFKKVVFVPYTCPGDIVKIKIVKEEKIFLEGEIISLVKKSNLRVEPKCEHFYTCGGCDWQHVDYKVQLDEKKKLLLHNFSVAQIDVPELEVIESPNQYSYRDKLRVAVSPQEYYGFYAKKTKNIVRIKACEIANPKLNGIFVSTPSSIALNKKEESFAYDYASKKIISEFANVKCSYYVGEFELAFMPESFVQNNLSLNSKLVDVVCEFVGNCKTISELYSGNGNFSLSLSRLATSVVCVEGLKMSHDLAKFNMAKNNVCNIKLIHADVNGYVSNIKSAIDAGTAQKFDCVVLDPSREGCDVMLQVSALSNRIVYVACNSKSLVSDSKTLVKEGFVLKKLVLLDMFAQTRHYETVAYFERN